MKINNLEKNYIIIYILSIIVLFLLYKELTRKEAFGTTNDITNAVSQVYTADIEALRNLSGIAKSLMEGNNLDFPGILTVTNNIVGSKDLTISGNITGNGNLTISGGIRLGPSSWLKQEDDWIRILSNPNDRNTYNKGFAGTNLWARDRIYASNRDILKELDDINNKINNTCIKDNDLFGFVNANGHPRKFQIDNPQWTGDTRGARFQFTATAADRNSIGEWETMRIFKR